jgi:hypothetical protein
VVRIAASGHVTVATEKLGAEMVEVNWRPRHELLLSALLAAAADEGAQAGRSLIQQLEAAGGDAAESALLHKLARSAVLLGRELRVALAPGHHSWRVLEEVRSAALACPGLLWPALAWPGLPLLCPALPWPAQGLLGPAGARMIKGQAGARRPPPPPGGVASAACPLPSPPLPSPPQPARRPLPLQVWDDDAVAALADPGAAQPPLGVSRELQAAVAAAREVQRIDPGQLLLARPLLRVLDGCTVLCEVQGVGLAVLPTPALFGRRQQQDPQATAAGVLAEGEVQVSRRHLLVAAALVAAVAAAAVAAAVAAAAVAAAAAAAGGGAQRWPLCALEAARPQLAPPPSPRTGACGARAA